jgi:hypothetical protein
MNDVYACQPVPAAALLPLLLLLLLLLLLCTLYMCQLPCASCCHDMCLLQTHFLR